MTIQAITLNLPEETYLRIKHVAEQIHRPVEDVIYQTIQGNLPPAIQDMPPELQQEMAILLNLDSPTLWALAQKPLSAKRWQRHQTLLEKAQAEALHPLP